MARTKTWTDEDREAALGWITGKARTGVVFRGQDESTEAMVARLTAITDLQDFAAAVQAALTTAAWKRLLGALRQRKHQADDEGQADEQGTQQADAGACASCARLQAEVESLRQQLASAINASQAKVKIDTIEADAGTQDEHGHQPVDQGHQPADEDGHQVQAALSAHQVAALALARSYMAAGKTLDSAARAASGKLRNALGCRLGEGGHIAVAPVQMLLKASEGQAITLESKAVRDEVIIILVKAGVQYKPLARALGISDGTVRNVIKRHQHQAEAA